MMSKDQAKFMGTLDDVGTMRKALVDAGYLPVPVYSIDYRFCGSPGKQPEGDGWADAARKGQTPPLSAKSMNTGVLCDGLRVIDIDVDDDDAARDVAELAREMIGDAPERCRGNSARRTLVYRAAEGQPRKKAIVSETLFNIDSKPAKVEVLGLGQQFVAFGFHPSGAELIWRGQSLHDVPRDELAEVPEDLIDAFLECAGEIIGARKGAEVQTAPVTKSVAELSRSYANNDANDDEIAELLAYVSADLPYEDWLNVLMAIHAGTNGSAAGMMMADRWSAQGRKYRGKKEIEAKWRSFKASGVSMATLSELARRGGADLSEIATKYRGMQPPEGYDAHQAKLISDNILKSAMQKRAVVAIADASDDEVVGAAQSQIDMKDEDLQCQGVVGEIADWICEWTSEPIRIHAVGAALTMVGTLIGRKVYTQKRPTCTALYIGAIAPSGLGKQHAQNAIKLALDEVVGHGNMHTGWSVSLPMVANNLQERASRVMIADEFADKLMGLRNRNAATSQTAISEGLRSLWGTNVSSYSPDASVTRGNIIIHRPNMSFFGSATIKDFSRSLVSKDVTNGLFNRFLILPRFEFVDPRPDPQGIMRLPETLKQRLSWLYNCLADPMQVSLAVRGDGFPAEPVMVPFTEDAAAMDEANKSHQIRMVRASDEDDALALYGRFAEQIKRVALIVACGRFPGDLTAARIERQDMEFARRIVEYSISQFVLLVRRDMVRNTVEENRAAVLSVIRRRKEVTRSQLLRQIRHINAREMRDIIGLLIDANCIVEGQVPTKTKPMTVYRYLRE